MVNIEEISPTLAYSYLKTTAMLIDVREGDEVDELSFDLFSIDNIAFTLFEENYFDIPKNRNLIFCCSTGERSMKAAEFLSTKGWDADKIFNLQGGMEAWKSDGLPTKKIIKGFTMGKASYTQSIDSSEVAY